MTIAVCPMTDSAPHDIFSTACTCGCSVTFIEGNMNITHQAHDEAAVESWGVFELDKQEDNQI